MRTVESAEQFDWLDLFFAAKGYGNESEFATIIVTVSVLRLLKLQS